MYRDLQHPVITNMERTGYPDGKEPDYPHCPVCGRECHTVYIDRNFEVVGCCECVDKVNAWECGECFPEDDCEEYTNGGIDNGNQESR